jgi:hypothetical protein
MTPWGIGCYEAATGRRPWEISHEEIQRDIAFAGRRLAALGVGAGDRVLVCSMLSEAGQFWPWIVGALLAGAQVSCADATRGDAARLATFTRHLTYRAVLGVNRPLLDGLDDLGRPWPEVFAGVALLGARPGAFGPLRAAGLAPHRFVVCGPVVGVGAEPDAPARVDGEEWELAAAGGHVLVTNRKERMTVFDRAPVAVRGRAAGDWVLPDETEA